MSTDITGGCLCRAVRYRISAQPLLTRVCWCRLCQYLATGNGSVNVCFRVRRCTSRASFADFRSVADSGNIMHRNFVRCGTQILSSAGPGRTWFLCAPAHWMILRWPRPPTI